MLNGLRHLRQRTQESCENLDDSFMANSKDTPLIIIMVFGLALSAGGISIVLYQVWVTERNKADILSLYALLKMH